MTLSHSNFADLARTDPLLALQPPRRRGLPPKVHPEAQAQAPAAIPEASSYEDAVRKLEALKLERAGGTRQVSLFDEEPQPS